MCAQLGWSLVQVSSLPELIAEPTGARSMSFVGTHEYLAPEIIKGEKRVFPRCVVIVRVSGNVALVFGGGRDSSDGVLRYRLKQAMVTEVQWTGGRSASFCTSCYLGRLHSRGLGTEPLCSTWLDNL